MYATRELGLPYVTESDLIRMSYRCAAILCANKDPDGLVTFEGIARERKIGLQAVYDFFERSPGLKQEWGIIDKAEIPRVRCRSAVARLKRKNPGQPIYRKTLAHELGWKEKNLCAYLISHPELVKELGIVYTPRLRNPASTHWRHRKKKQPAKP